MHRQAPALLLILLFPCAMAASARAQGGGIPPDVQPGSRVRVRTTDARTIIGRLTAGSGDALRVVPEHSSDTLRVVATRITALDVSVGRHKRRWRGAGIGLAGGMVLGAGAGAATYKSNNCTGDFCDVWGPWPNVVAGAVVGGAAGALAGAIIGNGTADSWRPVIAGVNGAGLLVPARVLHLAFGASLRF